MGLVDLSFWSGAKHKPTSISEAPVGASFMITGTTTVYRVPVNAPSENWVNLTDAQIQKSLKVADELLEFYNSHSNAFEPLKAV